MVHFGDKVDQAFIVDVVLATVTGAQYFAGPAGQKFEVR
jgi:hypothetical protein